MPLSEPQQAEVTRRYQASLGVLADTAAAVAIVGFADLDAYDEEDIPTFAAAISAPLAGLKARAVALATGFYSLTATTRPPAVRPDAVPVEMATRDPFIAYWRALSEGNQWTDAVTSGVARAGAEGERLVVSSARQTGDAMPAAARITGWRRVLSGNACTWCQYVSTQRYSTAESADFGHERCDCTVAPIYADADPGRVVNRDLLSQLKADNAGELQRINEAGTRKRLEARMALAERQVARLPAERRAVAAERIAAWAAAA